MRRFVSSTVGGKLIMGLTGLLLVGFLISHVGGNSLLLATDGGESYNRYAAKLRSFGPLLWVARAGLAALFVVHIFLAVRLSLQNRAARGTRYRISASRGGRALSSSSMLLTGSSVLVFLLAHLWHFSFDSRFVDEGAELVKRTLQEAGVVALYTVGVVCLWVHLWHALPSALRTLGLHHQRWSPHWNTASRIAISGICTLFLAILYGTYAG